MLVFILPWHYWCVCGLGFVPAFYWNVNWFFAYAVWDLLRIMASSWLWRLMWLFLASSSDRSTRDWWYFFKVSNRWSLSGELKIPILSFKTCKWEFEWQWHNSPLFFQYHTSWSVGSEGTTLTSGSIRVQRHPSQVSVGRGKFYSMWRHCDVTVSE